MPEYMAKDVRETLGKPSFPQASLYLDKFPLFPEDEKDKSSRGEFIARVCNSSFDSGGQQHRLSFLRAVGRKGGCVFQAKLMARLIVNQAGGVIENAGICLDRHFGTPYIAGSALKGISRAAAIGAWREGRGSLEQILAVFGWSPGVEREFPDRFPSRLARTSFGGSVAFLAAYPDPGVRLAADIVTCHHPKYYTGKQEPDDDESPIPNTFPTVEAGALFTFALIETRPGSGGREARELLPELDPNTNLLLLAEGWLKEALTEWGAGAKTAAGYGWFQLHPAKGAGQ